MRRKRDITLTVDDSGAYLNILHDEQLVVSISDEHDEILIYDGEHEEPIATHSLP